MAYPDEGTMRALITGCEGFLGANLAKELIAQGVEVTGTSLNRQGKTSLEALGVDCRIEYGDVTDAQFVERVVSTSEPDWVFHLAAVSIVRVANASPGRTMGVNIQGTVNVLDACRFFGVGKVLIASSDKAYGDHNGKPYVEDMPLKPTGAYEVSKACADMVGQFYNAIVLRCANIYGCGDLNWSRLIPNSCRLALNGESPRIYGGAVNAKREWMHVSDAVSAYIHLANVGLPGAYNVGTGEQSSPLEVAEMITRITGTKMPGFVEKEREFYEIQEQVLNCDKMHGLGWKSKHSITLGLLETVQWYEDYLK